MSTDGEVLVHRFFQELCNERRAEVADEIVAANYVSHGPQAPPAEGPEGVKERVAVYQDALDGNWDVVEMFPGRGPGRGPLDRARDAPG